MRLHSPAEQATTPFHRSSELRCAILLYSPRSLKLKTGCRSSLLRSTLHSSRLLMLMAGVRGVSWTTSYTREVRIRRRYCSCLISWAELGHDTWHTSGWPSGSRNASGTEEEAAVFSKVGLAEYSVRGIPLGTPIAIDIGAIFSLRLSKTGREMERSEEWREDLSFSNSSNKSRSNYVSQCTGRNLSVLDRS